MQKIAAVFAIFIGITSYVSAFTVPDKPSGFVSDYANVLQMETKNALEEQLRIFTASTTNELAVVIVPEVGGDTIERYAVKLFESWKIGNAKNDNGILLLVAVAERKVRIEVGYGLEGAVPDILAKYIIDTQIIPEFKQGDYSRGIVQGVQSLIEATKGEYVAMPVTTKTFDFSALEAILIAGFFFLQFLSSIFARSKSWWAGGIVGGTLGVVVTIFGIFGITILMGAALTLVLVLLGLLFDYVVSNAYTHSVAHGGSIPWWAGGGSGRSSGGFGGFGGGSSGGGGASGSW